MDFSWRDDVMNPDEELQNVKRDRDILIFNVISIFIVPRWRDKGVTGGLRITDPSINHRLLKLF